MSAVSKELPYHWSYRATAQGVLDWYLECHDEWTGGCVGQAGAGWFVEVYSDDCPAYRLTREDF